MLRGLVLDDYFEIQEKGENEQKSERGLSNLSVKNRLGEGMKTLIQMDQNHFFLSW